MTDIERVKIERAVEAVTHGTGYGVVQIHIQDGRIHRISRNEEELVADTTTPLTKM